YARVRRRRGYRRKAPRDAAILAHHRPGISTHHSRQAPRPRGTGGAFGAGRVAALLPFGGFRRRVAASAARLTTCGLRPAFGARVGDDPGVGLVPANARRGTGPL